MAPVRDSRGYLVHVPHGTYSRYTHGACRCAECREANRIACWLRRNGLGPGRRPVSHGIWGYIKGCRCDTCRAAKSYWSKRLYRQRKERAAAIEHPKALDRAGDPPDAA